MTTTSGASTSAELRIGDAEHERAVSELGEHFAAGRLTPDELDERLGAAWAAKTASDLQALFVDLPGRLDLPGGQLDRSGERFDRLGSRFDRPGRPFGPPGGRFDGPDGGFDRPGGGFDRSGGAPALRSARSGHVVRGRHGPGPGFPWPLLFVLAVVLTITTHVPFLLFFFGLVLMSRFIGAGFRRQPYAIRR